MGSSSSSCETLEKTQNACELYKCIEKVTGLRSNSASYSDTWILHFKKGTKYEGKEIKSGFMKLWVSDIDPIKKLYSDYFNTYLPNLKLIEKVELQRNLAGLNYELDIYKDVIRPLVDRNICPNFIRYLGSGLRCKSSDVLKFLTSSTKKFVGEDKEEAKKRFEQEAKKRFVRNFEYLVGTSLDTRGRILERPSITDTNTQPPNLITGNPENSESFFNDFDKFDNSTDDPEIFNVTEFSTGDSNKNNFQSMVWNCTFNLLINENITQNDKKLSQVITQFVKRRKIFSKEKKLVNKIIFTNKTEFWHIMFQIIAACYAMSLTKTTHNDLHSSNVFVRENDSEHSVLYNYNYKSYKMKTKYTVRIYDFDRAYNVKRGENLFLQDSYLKNKCSQSNEFIPNRDAVKICSYIYSDLIYFGLDEEAEELLNALSPESFHGFAKCALDPETFLTMTKNMKPFLESEGFAKDFQLDKNIKASHFNIFFYSIEEMLDRFGKKIQKKETKKK